MAQPIPQLDFVTAVKLAIARIKDMEGRSRRSEFWWFWLACYVLNFILYIPISILMSKKNQLIQDAMFGRISLAEADSQDPTTLIIIFGILMAVVGLALLIPQLAAMCRRLHDVGKSGHMMWLFLVCGVGGLVPLIMCIPDGRPEPNQYGESPKYVLQQ